MKKTFFFSMILLLLIVLTSCRESAGKAEQQLVKEVSDTNKIKAISELVREYRIKDPKKTLKSEKEAQELFKKFPGNKIMINILTDIGWAYHQLGKYKESWEYAMKAKKLARKLDEKKGVALALRLLGNISKETYKINKALDYLKEAKNISEKTGDELAKARALTPIGIIYKDLKYYVQAKENLSVALKIFIEKKEDKLIVTGYNNMGLLYSDMKEFENALYCYHEALKIAKDQEYDSGIAFVSKNIGFALTQVGEYERAHPFLLKAFELNKSLDNKRNYSRASRCLSEYNLKLKNLKKAIYYANESYKIADEIGHKADKLKSLITIVRIFESKRDYKKAFDSQKEINELKDVLNKEIVELLKAKFAGEKKFELLKKENRIQKIYNAFLIFSSIFILIVAFLTYKSFLTKKKAEKVLLESEKKLREANAYKDHLFAIIAHDLGSPFSSLLQSSQYLEENFNTLGKEDLREFVSHIYQNTKNVFNLLENLMNWALSQIGKMKTIPEKLDIKALVDETIEQLRYVAGKKSIKILSFIPQNSFICGDRNMIKAVIRNLLSNAIKYTYPEGEVKITSKTMDDFLKITVSDNGIGIDEQKIVRLFKIAPLQPTRGTANEKKGTGLGLLLCKDFVEKNGGKIWVESELNKGTHFSFTIPGGS